MIFSDFQIRKLFLARFYLASLQPGGLASKLFFLLMSLVVFSVTGFAASLTDYNTRIESARSKIEVLFQTLESDDTAAQLKLIAGIEQDVPATETVEWPGGSVETDNNWLRLNLKAFTDEPNESRRGAILTEISERLLGISKSVGNLDKTAESDQTKDQDKQKLAEILRREEFQKPQAKEESLFARWWREFLEWLASVFPRPNASPAMPSGIGSLQFGLQILIYTLLIAIIGFLAYKVAPFLFRRFGDKTYNEKRDRVILGERIGADESATDLFSEAEQLAHEGNLRAAIRKGYIALLCDLSDRKIVRLARHKTNRDYLRDVRSNNDLFENMHGLTQNFENNWYGLRTAEQADWEDFKSLYMRAIVDSTVGKKR